MAALICIENLTVIAIRQSVAFSRAPRHVLASPVSAISPDLLQRPGRSLVPENRCPVATEAAARDVTVHPDLRRRVSEDHQAQSSGSLTGGSVIRRYFKYFIGYYDNFLYFLKFPVYSIIFSFLGIQYTQSHGKETKLHQCDCQRFRACRYY